MIWVGIVFIVIAAGLVVGELFTGSGLLLGLAILSLIFGLVVFFSQGSVLLEINWWLAIPLMVVVLALVVFIVLRVVHTYHIKAATGKEDMEGKTAIVKKTIDPEGIVLYQGELWNAISKTGRIDPGEEVIIEKVDGLWLQVAKKPGA